MKKMICSRPIGVAFNAKWIYNLCLPMSPYREDGQHKDLINNNKLEYIWCSDDLIIFFSEIRMKKKIICFLT